MNNTIEIVIDKKEVKCKLVASFIMKNNEYVILMDDNKMVYAFRVDNDELMSIEDENELNDVMTILEKGYSHQHHH